MCDVICIHVHVGACVWYVHVYVGYVYVFVCTYEWRAEDTSSVSPYLLPGDTIPCRRLHMQGLLDHYCLEILLY